MSLTIAIDGPAASGKGTIARRLATHFKIPHLDTGLTYRAVAHALLQAGQPLDDEALAVITASKLDLGLLDRKILADHKIGEAASKIAVMPRLRKALVEAQRRFAGLQSGAVLDGRDIGTVVLPHADIKLYITASAKVRANRRYAEIIADGNKADASKILADIINRDERDMGRADSPLKPAEDAHLIDTSEMDIEAAFKTVLHYIEENTSQ